MLIARNSVPRASQADLLDPFELMLGWHHRAPTAKGVEPSPAGSQTLRVERPRSERSYVVEVQ